ncbi:MAG: hypothetical protein JW709_12525 [Sedimentisphaerales bacterium]|nr:hypothetical protein [Sedimentisphaerales bacterium]
MKRHAKVDFSILSILIFVGFLGGCTSVIVRPVGKENADEEGVHFYRPAPYLLVTKQNDKIESKIIYLPELSQEYVIQYKPGLGTAKVDIVFENGWNLTSIGQTTDTKIPETISAVGGLMSSGGSLYKANGIENYLAPGLYKLKYQHKDAIYSLQKIDIE